MAPLVLPAEFGVGLVCFCTCGSVCAVYPSEQEEQGLRSMIRLSLLWNFLRGAQDLSPSPHQGLQLRVPNAPGTQGRGGRASPPSAEMVETVAKQNTVT